MYMKIGIIGIIIIIIIIISSSSSSSSSSSTIIISIMNLSTLVGFKYPVFNFLTVLSRRVLLSCKLLSHKRVNMNTS